MVRHLPRRTWLPPWRGRIAGGCWETPARESAEFEHGVQDKSRTAKPSSKHPTAITWRASPKYPPGSRWIGTLGRACAYFESGEYESRTETSLVLHTGCRPNRRSNRPGYTERHIYHGTATLRPPRIHMHGNLRTDMPMDWPRIDRIRDLQSAGRDEEALSELASLENTSTVPEENAIVWIAMANSLRYLSRLDESDHQESGCETWR